MKYILNFVILSILSFQVSTAQVVEPILTQWDTSLFYTGGAIFEKANGYELVGRENGQSISVSQLNGSFQIIHTEHSISQLGILEEVTPTQDGGYIACGIRATTNSNVTIGIAKLDSTGNLNWEARSQYESRLDLGTSILETSDGGYLAGGTSLQGNNFQNQGFVNLLKIANDGKSVWERAFSGYKGWVTDIVEAPNQDLLVTARVYGKGTDSDAILIRLSPNGDSLWSSQYGSENEKIERILETKDQHFFLCGHGYDFQEQKMGLIVSKVDENGNSFWKHYFKLVNQDSGVSYNHTLNHASNTSDGGCVLLGELSYNLPHGTQKNMFIVKVDAHGNEQWQKHLPFSQFREAVSHYILPLKEGGYLFMGTVVTLPTQTQTSRWVSFMGQLGPDGTTDLDLEFEQNGILVSPNPFKELIEVNHEFQRPGQAEIRMLDMAGRLVKKQVFSIGSGPQTLALTTKNLGSGFYLLRLTSGKEVFVKKVFKE